MVKIPGIGFLKKIFKKNDSAKPVDTQKVIVSPAKNEPIGAHPIDISADLLENEWLEETPVINDTEKGSLQKRSKHKKDKSNQFLIEKQNVNFAGDAKAELQKRRYNNRSVSLTGRIKSLFDFLRKTNKTKKTNKSAAFEFAANKKRFGKKGKRNKRIMLYAGTGLTVIVVMLVVVLVPGGAAAPADYTEGTQGSASPTYQEKSGLDFSEADYAAAAIQPAVIPSSSPSADGSMGGIPTTEQTQAPTIEPTETLVPIPTTEPESTHVSIDINDLVDYYMVEDDTYYNDMGYDSNFYEYTQDELYMMAQLITGEARGESYEGKIAVGNVVMNRVLCHSFGSSIKSVITASGQFSGYRSSIKPSSSCMSAAKKVLDFEYWVIPQNVYYFRATSSTSNWYAHDFFKKIGGHVFYTDYYRGRTRVSTVPKPLFERTYKWPRYGCKPEDRVYRIQYMLNGLGYDVYADRYFGIGTMEAIKEFQASKGLDADGVAGPTTIKELINAYGLIDYYNDFLQ